MPMVAAHVRVCSHLPSPTTTAIPSSNSFLSSSNQRSRVFTRNPWKCRAVIANFCYSSSPPPPPPSWSLNQTVGGQLLQPASENCWNIREINGCGRGKNKRVFLLDVNPLCYNGSIPSLHHFAHWASLFFSQVSLSDPVIAVIDGERGDQYRKQLLPSYKAHRRKLPRQHTMAQRFPKGSVWRSHQVVINMLRKLDVPVVKIEGHEADDVVATLADKVLHRGYKVVIASPDKDFKQLISDDVQIVMPMPELGRWSFYTLKHYITQYGCDPSSDLSLRCMMGDETDGVPGIQHVAPGFGRKTALKLLRKHGSLENLLNTAAVRTVGRQYAQDALTKYADYLRRNYEVLALRRDIIEVHLQEEWLSERETCNDSVVLSTFSEAISRKPEAHSPK